MNPEERQLAEAIRSLRETLQESQQQFSNRLGVVVRTVARYELEKPPRGAILLKLAEIARSVERDDLGQLFEEAWARAVVEGRMRVIRELGAPHGSSWAEAFAWLLSFGAQGFENRLNSLLSTEIRRVLTERGYPLTDAERELFGDLGGEHLKPSESSLEPTGTLFSLAKHPHRRQDLPFFEAHLQPTPTDPQVQAAIWLAAQPEARENFHTYLTATIAGLIDQRGSELTEEERAAIGELAQEAVELHAKHQQWKREIGRLTLPAAMRGVREQMEMSLAEAADAIRISESTLAHYEAGKKEPELAALFRLSTLAHHRLSYVSPDTEVVLTAILDRLRLGSAPESGAASVDYIDWEKAGHYVVKQVEEMATERSVLQSRVRDLEERLAHQPADSKAKPLSKPMPLNKPRSQKRPT